MLLISELGEIISSFSWKVNIWEWLSQQQMILVIASTILALISPVIYAASMVRGESKPARMTRFIVWLASTISFFSLLFWNSEGALFLAGIFMIRNVFLLGMSTKYGVGWRDRVDQVCLVIAVGGLVCWRLFDEPLWALLASIVADIVWYFPAYLKTWKEPKSEWPMFYFIEIVAIVLNIIVIGAWSIDLLFPGYILVSGVAMLAVIYKDLWRERLVWPSKKDIQ